MANKSILMITGEHSGDLLGANLIQACKQHHRDWQFTAMGGQPIEDAGADILVSNDKLAIIGFVEVLRHLKKLSHILKIIKNFIKTNKPDLVILIDYPGFNLKVAAYAHRMGCKVLFYTSPQIWAWKAGRIKRIKRDVDHMAVLFPFEETIYQQAGVPVTVVGHPMLKRFKKPIEQDVARHHLNLDINTPLLAILPGSRRSEIKRLMPVILKTARQLKNMLPSLNIIIALAETVDTPDIPDDMQTYISVISKQTDRIVAASDAVICASGTATLEVALAEKPLVIIYKTSMMTYALAKCFMKIPYIGLCNIVADQLIAQELIQHRLSANALTAETLRLLNDDDYRSDMRKKLSQTRHCLGDQHNAEKLVEVMATMLE